MCLHVSLVMLEKERQPSSCPLLFHCCQCPPSFACAFACEGGYTESLAVCPLPAHAPTLPLPFHVGSHTTPLCANREHRAAHIRYTPLLSTLATTLTHTNRQQEQNAPPFGPEAPVYA